MSYPYIQKCNIITLVHPTKLSSSINSKEYLKKVLRLSLSGTQIPNICSGISDYLIDSDLMTKKIACWLISRHCGREDSWLLVINTLVMFSEDPNPLVRVMSVKTITAVKHYAVIEHALKAVVKCLEDENEFVRRAAVNGIIKLCQINPSYFIMHNQFALLQKLKSMVQDKDGVVVTNALLVLHELTSVQLSGGLKDDVCSESNNGGEKNRSNCDDDATNISSVKMDKIIDPIKPASNLVITKNLVHHLLSKFSGFTDCGKVIIVRIVSQYIPNNANEVLYIMNILDPYINNNKHNNSNNNSNNDNDKRKYSDTSMISLTAAIIALFLALVNKHLPKLKKEVLTRTSAVIFKKTSKQPNETIWAVLDFIGCYFGNLSGIQIFEYNHFVSNPVYLKIKKINLAPCFIDDSNKENSISKVFDLTKLFYNIEYSNSIKLNLIRCLSTLLKLRDENGNNDINFQIIDFLFNLFEKERHNFQIASSIVQELTLFLILYYNKSNCGTHPSRCNDGNHEKMLRILCRLIIEIIDDRRLPKQTLISSLIFMSSLRHADWLKVSQGSQQLLLGEGKSCNLLIGIDEPIDDISVSKLDDDACSDSDDNGGEIEGDVAPQVISDLFSGIKNDKNEKKKKNNKIKLNIFEKSDEAIDVNELATEMLYKIEMIIDNVEKYTENKYRNMKHGASKKEFKLNENCLETILSVISALFIAYPAMYHNVFGRILELCFSHDEPFLKFKSLYLNRILEDNIDNFEQFIDFTLNLG